jgi:hypothetical protein
MGDSTEIALVKRDSFLALTEGSDVAEALRENMDGGFSEQDLIQVKTPSGGAQFWEIEGPGGVQSAAHITGVIVYRCLKGLLWKSDDPGEDKPVLVSDDMKVANLAIPWDEVPAEMQAVLEKHELTAAEVREYKKISPDIPESSLPRLFWWDGPNKLPYCEYGSSEKEGSKGKRAKDKQVLYVLRRNEGLPLRIELGPTSIREVRRFFAQMSDVPHTRAEVKIGLKKLKSPAGKDYSVVTLERVNILDKEAGDMITALYKRPIMAAHESGKMAVIGSNVE